MYLLILDDIVASGVASGAVACEHLSTVLQVSSKGGRSDGDHAREKGGSDLLCRFNSLVQCCKLALRAFLEISRLHHQRVYGVSGII